MICLAALGRASFNSVVPVLEYRIPCTRTKHTCASQQCLYKIILLYRKKGGEWRPSCVHKATTMGTRRPYVRPFYDSLPTRDDLCYYPCPPAQPSELPFVEYQGPSTASSVVSVLSRLCLYLSRVGSSPPLPLVECAACRGRFVTASRLSRGLSARVNWNHKVW